MKKLNLIFITLFSLTVLFNQSCSEDIDPCEGVVCANGGECGDQGECACPPGFGGPSCLELLNAKEVKITKVIVTDFLEFNGDNPWDQNDGPDLNLELTKGTDPQGFVLGSSEVIENGMFGNDYEFTVDWSMEGDETSYNIALFDNDDDIDSGLNIIMGSNQIYLADHRETKPTTIDLPTLSGGFLGLRIEVEWIF